MRRRIQSRCLPPRPPLRFASCSRSSSPYGIATLIALLAASGEAQRTEVIIALLVVVMILNLIAMLFARKVLVGVTMLVLQILGGVLGVLQAALAVEFIVHGLRALKVIGG